MNQRAADLEREADRAVIDLMLAHLTPDMSSSEYAYNRAPYLKHRYELGQAWAAMMCKDLNKPMSLMTDVGRQRSEIIPDWRSEEGADRRLGSGHVIKAKAIQLPKSRIVCRAVNDST